MELEEDAPGTYDGRKLIQVDSKNQTWWDCKKSDYLKVMIPETEMCEICQLEFSIREQEGSNPLELRMCSAVLISGIFNRNSKDNIVPPVKPYQSSRTNKACQAQVGSAGTSRRKE